MPYTKCKIKFSPSHFLSPTKENRKWWRKIDGSSF